MAMRESEYPEIYIYVSEKITDLSSGFVNEVLHKPP